MVLNKRTIGILGLVAFILAVPLVGMQFTDAIAWKLSDFVIAGILLLGAATAIEFIARKLHKTGPRIIWITLIIAILILTWIELAVGIFGTPIAGS